MSKLTFSYEKARAFIGEHELAAMSDFVKAAHDKLHNKTGLGNDFLGWVNLPENYDK